jgi:hypothetical protein
MPFDWEAFESELDGAIKRSAGRTEEALAARASSISRLTTHEIMTLFPTPSDLRPLKDLMKIIKSDDRHDQKIKHLVEGIDDLAGTVVTLLEKLS